MCVCVFSDTSACLHTFTECTTLLIHETRDVRVVQVSQYRALSHLSQDRFEGPSLAQTMVGVGEEGVGAPLVPCC